MRSTRALPAIGGLWLSRPPFLFIARVTAVDTERLPALVEYDLYDGAGALLCDAIAEPFDASWFTSFQPLVARHG